MRRAFDFSFDCSAVCITRRLSHNLFGWAHHRFCAELFWSFVRRRHLAHIIVVRTCSRHDTLSPDLTTRKQNEDVVVVVVVFFRNDQDELLLYEGRHDDDFVVLKKRQLSLRKYAVNFSKS